MRKNSYMVKLIEGRLSGGRGRGRPRRQFIKLIAQDVGVNCSKMKRLVWKVRVWRIMHFSNLRIKESRRKIIFTVTVVSNCNYAVQ